MKVSSSFSFHLLNSRWKLVSLKVAAARQIGNERFNKFSIRRMFDAMVNGLTQKSRRKKMRLEAICI